MLLPWLLAVKLNLPLLLRVSLSTPALRRKLGALVARVASTSLVALILFALLLRVYSVDADVDVPRPLLVCADQRVDATRISHLEAIKKTPHPKKRAL